MDIKVSLKTNKKEILKAAAEQIERGMMAIGIEAESNAKDICPVDTGRLRNSITFATSTTQGAANNRDGQSADANDYATHGNPESGSVYIGTNVEYAPYIEEGSSRRKARPFLKTALTKHIDRYKQLLEAALKS